MLVRGRLQAVRGKGKSAFLVLRQPATGATVQAILFVDDRTVSKVRPAPRALPRPSRASASAVRSCTRGLRLKPYTLAAGQACCHCRPAFCFPAPARMPSAAQR